MSEIISDPYLEFLASKQRTHIESGFEVDINTLNPKLFLFQKFCVHRALKYGKYGVFSGTGTGKSLMEASWAFEVVKHTNKSVLILAPLEELEAEVASYQDEWIDPDRIETIDFGYSKVEYIEPDNLKLQLLMQDFKELHEASKQTLSLFQA